MSEWFCRKIVQFFFFFEEKKREEGKGRKLEERDRFRLRFLIDVLMLLPSLSILIYVSPLNFALAGLFF